MARKRFTSEQIITMLREAEVLLNQGSTVIEVARKLGIAEQTYYRWRKEYGGMRVDQAKRLPVWTLRLAQDHCCAEKRGLEDQSQVCGEDLEAGRIESASPTTQTRTFMAYGWVMYPPSSREEESCMEL